MEHILFPLIPLMALFIPIYVVKRRYDLKERERQHQLASPDSQPQLEALVQERKLLQARIENLESIVCSVDHELNLRLANLMSLPGEQATMSPAREPPDVAVAEPLLAAAGGGAVSAKGAHAATAAISSRTISSWANETR